MKLQKGKMYNHEDITRLVLVGFSAGSKFVSANEFNLWDYFDNGIYTGPGPYGEEPVFSENKVNLG